jgi:hypothetical protein
MTDDMSRHAAKQNPPGGRRVGAAELARRLAFVERLLAHGRPRSEIVDACRARFGAAPRTTDGLIARVRAVWIQQASDDRVIERPRAIARLERRCRQLARARAWSALISAERLLCDLRGLRGDPALLGGLAAAPPAQSASDMSAEEALVELGNAALVFASLARHDPRAAARAREIRDAFNRALGEEESGESPTSPGPELGSTGTWTTGPCEEGLG